MTELLISIVAAIVVGVGVKWLVSAKEQYFEIFNEDHKSND